MNGAAVLFPDGVAVAITYLSDLLDVPVVPRVPHERPESFVTVARVGGVRATVVSDRPTLTFEAWAASDEDAQDLIQETRRHLHDMPRQVIDGTTVYGVTEVAGPHILPDPDSEQPRYVFTASVHVRGTSTGS